MNDLGLYGKFELGSDSGTLLVAFSHRDMPPGKFSQYKILQDLPFSKLFINCEAHTWYVDGIPGLGATVDETAQAILRIRHASGARKVATFGYSMGGYASLVYGPRIAADVILAFSPEIILNTPFSRSEDHLNGKEAADPLKVIVGLQDYPAERVFSFCGDSEAVDLLQSMILQEKTSVRPYMLRNCEHETVPFLFRRELLIPLLREIISSDRLTADVGRRTCVLPEMGTLLAVEDFSSVPSGDKVATFYEAIADRVPPTPNLHQQIGSAYRKMGQQHAALLHFKRAHELDGGKNPRHSRNLGRQYAIMGEHLNALEPLREALELGADTDVPEMLAEAMTKLGRDNEAVQLLIEAGPTSPRRLLMLGRLYSKTKRLAEAESCFEQVREMEPRNFSNLYDLAYLLVGRGAVDKGMTHLYVALELDPNADRRQAQRMRIERQVNAPI